MGNLTARGTHLRYVVFRYGDPLVHVPGSASSRTACGWSVTNYDRVDVADDAAVTCVQCAVVDILRLARGDEAEQYGKAIAEGFARELTKLGIK